MKLEVTGRYHQIAKFFYNVGQLDRIINMENISLLEPKVVDDAVVVRADMLATAFRALASTDKARKGKDDKAKENPKGSQAK